MTREPIHQIVATLTVRGRSGSRDSAWCTRLPELVETLYEDKRSTQGGVRKSSALREDPSLVAVVDHPVPNKWFIEKLLSLPEEDLRAPYVKHLAELYVDSVELSEAELEVLHDAGLDDSMPPDWDGVDRLARYSTCRITIGDDQSYTVQTFKHRLSNPPYPFYVYVMADPKDGHPFYIGKGTGDRALMHERELTKRRFPVHTNWKKLNRMAQLLNSGRGIEYRIDSWHLDDHSARLREDDLIFIYERADSRRLTNSNGRRWRGKASKALLAYRERVGAPAID